MSRIDRICAELHNAPQLPWRPEMDACIFSCIFVSDRICIWLLSVNKSYSLLSNREPQEWIVKYRVRVLDCFQNHLIVTQGLLSVLDNGWQLLIDDPKTKELRLVRIKIYRHACASVVVWPTFPAVTWHKMLFRATCVWVHQPDPPSPSTFVSTQVFEGLGSHKSEPTQHTIAGESDCSPSAHEFRAPVVGDVLLYRRGVERIHRGPAQGLSRIPKPKFVLCQILGRP